MTGRRRQSGRLGLYFFMFVWLVVLLPLSVSAAPYAELVMDARNGKVIHSQNADTRLHPASLTKMMTLYIAFEAVQNGEISMDSLVTISAKAANEEPSRLGLKPGQKIALRYLVRAAAVKSANDASTAIAEAIEGSEAAFARRMNRTAKALGMTRTTFKNAHGLTEEGHLSTARDMSILGWHVIYDYPEYYNLFSRKTADAGVRTVSHTNSRLLSSYKGADGIKTGYTRAAGFNLVASAERGSERVIATVFGGRSGAARNARIAELLDLGFKESPTWVNVRKPKMPPYQGKGPGAVEVVVASTSDPMPGTRAKSIRVASGAVTRSLRPVARPNSTVDPALVAPIVASVGDDIMKELKEVAQVSDTAAASLVPKAAPTAAPAPAPAPVRIAAAVPEPPAAPAASVRPPVIAAPAPAPAAVAEATIVFKDTPTPAREAEVVTRLSTSGGKHWGINLGRFPSEYSAQKILLKVALAEDGSLGDANRKIVKSKAGYDATFMGMSRDSAELACRRLQARQINCFMVGPG